MQLFVLIPLLILSIIHKSLGENDQPRLRVSKAAEDLAMDARTAMDDTSTTTTKWSAATYSDAVTTLPLHHRAMLSVAQRLCELGLPAPCICTEAAVQSAIAAAITTSGRLVRPTVRICSGVYIDISNPINMTARSFRLICSPLPLPGICGLNGGNVNQLLIGAPDDVTVFALSFDRGRAGNNTDGNGGVIKITGGSLEIKESQFFDNRADRGFGAGIYATGNGTKVSISSSRFEGNRAVIGGAFYFTNGAELDLKRTAFLYNNATKGGAMAFYNANGRLQSNTISGNFANVSGNDLYIEGNATLDSTGFVTCVAEGVNIFPNLFCDGPDGIIDGGSKNNTNCAASVDSSGLRCALT